MTLQQLTYIKMTAECGNITEAAEKLFISQPSLSAAIHNLEKEMGVTIFVRSKKGVVLTREGEELLFYAGMLLAMCTSLLCREAFATEEISYEQAITYLRKEAITLPVTAPRGYVLLTYRHIPLGFVKNIGNRANNLYPQEWRIRSGYLPENIRILSEYVTD